MNNSILICILVSTIFIFLYLNKTNLKYVESSLTGTKYLVQNDKHKEETAGLLEKIIVNMYKLKNYLKKNIDKEGFIEFSIYIKQLDEKLTKERTTIYENTKNSDLTSYSVNKGEEIVFCLKSKKTNKNHKINTIMYVAIHELAHLGCPEIGHTPLFNKIFKFFLEKAIEIKLYTYQDYEKSAIEYCGMVLTTNILN